MTSKVPCLTALAAAAAFWPANAIAQDWQFTVTPYLMAPTMDGQTGVGPLEAQVSSSAADIFRNLNWGAMGILEANNGSVGVAADLTYMNLESKRDGLVNEFGGHQGAYTGMFLARIDPHAEVYVGARFNELGVRISGTGPLGNQLSGKRSHSWVDPIIGMRVNLPFNDNTDLTVMGDMGGFGAGSDISFQAWPMLGFRLGDSTKALAGYRIIYVDYETGEGLKRFKYDVVTHGPTVGVQLRF